MAGVAACAAPQARTAELPRAVPIAPPAGLAVDAPPVPAKPKPLDARRYRAHDLFEPAIHERETIAIEARWRSRPGEPAVVDVAEIDYLGRCARSFILQQPESARRALVSALSLYVTSCDDTGKPVLERPLGFDSRDRKTRSDAMLLGTVAPRGAGLVLRVSACGPMTPFDRIAIVDGDHRWTSPRLEVRRDAHGCDVAELPFTKALAVVIERALAHTDVSLEFEGAGSALLLTDQLRDELRSVLDAVDAITEP